ncbi:MAG: DNA primase [Patescibacteria group bacterium]
MNAFEKVQSRITLVEIVEEYTPVINRGSYFVARCPFHKEKTPSLSINNEKGVYYCFGCMASGNIFSFVQGIENISKKEALERLAAKVGITLDEKQQDDKYDKDLSILDTVTNLYHQALLFYLKSDNYVSNYINQRRLTTKTLNDFRIGYAPNSDFLTNFFKKNDIPLQLGLDTGLLISKDGRIKDKFVDRLIIPVTNESTKVVGFTGRVFPNDQSNRPKYLNSPETKYFQKSKILYGIDKAKSIISKDRKCILVEGNMDVIMAHQYGFQNVIATQGTATTTEQINRIKRTNAELILAFDNDNAGRTSEYKIAKMAYDNTMEVSKLSIADKYKDFDEYLNNENIKTLNTQPYIEFYIKNKTELTSKDLSIQKKAINECMNLTNNADPVTQAQTLNIIKQLTNLDNDILKQIQNQSAQTPERNLPEAKIDPVLAQFYQMLALDQQNSNLPIIYNLLKEKLNFATESFDEFIEQEEVKWLLNGEKEKYKGVDPAAMNLNQNLIINLNRIYSKDSYKKSLLQNLKLSTD